MKNNNIVVDIYNDLLQEKQKLELEYQRLQRQRDLKIDTIDKQFSIKIDKILRKSEVLSMQIEQAKKYLSKN